ncbi:hypothetical protein DH2020_019067 [Rehmannia glutinosa]|uniref:Aldose 1-epimerase n=1 Tax=Rehmannia glutinosa TaxID=99300 RepID=A0ABR0WQ30_REHGL
MAEPKLFELNNGTMQVKVSNFGCTITSLSVPDKDGRVANRIKDGKFSLNGVEYALPINKPPNSLHGGHKGFDKVIWEVAEYKQGDNPSITFKYNSHDGEEDICKSSHSVDHNTVPTGEIMPVKGTPFDFTTENKIGDRIHEVGLGYDHNYVLDCGDEKSGLKHAAKLKDPNSLRTLSLWTNAPGMQFYTANYVNGIVGKGGAVYGKHAAACLETQGYPNAINQPNFPSVVVQPGETYKHCMLFEFSAE